MPFGKQPQPLFLESGTRMGGCSWLETPGLGFPLGDCLDVLDIGLLRLPNDGCTEPEMALV